jgi:phosphoglycolate phosphatase
MDYLFGVDNLDGATKLARAHELVAQVRATGRGAGAFVIIGDSLHDKEVADALGVGCVLFAQGSHSAERLRAIAPTADTLEEAVVLAGC